MVFTQQIVIPTIYSNTWFFYNTLNNRELYSFHYRKSLTTALSSIVRYFLLHLTIAFFDVLVKSRWMNYKLFPSLNSDGYTHSIVIVRERPFDCDQFSLVDVMSHADRKNT